MSEATAPLRIVVSGTESTGKTTLARTLAEWLGTEWVPEFSRSYAESKPGALDAHDVDPIALGTIAADDAASARVAAAAGRALVLDTDLASTLVYARHYYDLAPAWIESAWRSRAPALYLLCHPDVPWVPDTVRDRPRGRDELHAMFEARLAGAGVPVVSVRGDWARRARTAREAVRELLSAGAAP